MSGYSLDDVIISITFTVSDIEWMTEEAEIDMDTAYARVDYWASSIEDSAVEVINEQLRSVVEYDIP